MIIRRHVLGVAVFCTLVSTCIACTSGARSGPSGSPLSPSPAPASSQPTAAPSRTSASSSDPLTTEAAARAAVEAAWAKFWVVYLTAERNPPVYSAAQLPSEVSAVAVDPTRTEVLKAVAGFQAVGLSSYGTVGHRVSWTGNITGQHTAVLNDCMDTSKSGSLWAKTQKKRTVGTARNNTHGTLTRAADGQWRVQQIVYLLQVAC